MRTCLTKSSRFFMRSTAKMCKSCRSRQEFSYEHLVFTCKHLASIEPRTGLSKFAKLASGQNVLSQKNENTHRLTSSALCPGAQTRERDYTSRGDQLFRFSRFFRFHLLANRIATSMLRGVFDFTIPFSGTQHCCLDFAGAERTAGDSGSDEKNAAASLRSLM